MKVTIKDSQILKTVNPDVLQAHLQATGWHETGRIYNDAGAIWRLKKDAAPEYEILLPLQHNLGDYAERISDILKILSAVENRDQVDILSEFITNYPNFTVQGVVMQIATPPIDKLSGEITLLCAVFDKLQEIKTSLVDHDYILAIKAYQERLPIRCTGDLVKEDNHFILKNPTNLLFNNM
jgi:hypothetical protein